MNSLERQKQNVHIKNIYLLPTDVGVEPISPYIWLLDEYESDVCYEEHERVVYHHTIEESLLGETEEAEGGEEQADGGESQHHGVNEAEK